MYGVSYTVSLHKHKQNNPTKKLDKGILIRTRDFRNGLSEGKKLDKGILIRTRDFRNGLSEGQAISKLTSSTEFLNQFLAKF